MAIHSSGHDVILPQQAECDGAQTIRDAGKLAYALNLRHSHVVGCQLSILLEGIGLRLRRTYLL